MSDAVPPMEELTGETYRELRALAAQYLARERVDHTLQPTALVHEAYLRLAGRSGERGLDRGHFMALAAKIMRQILVDHARAHRAAKRGSGRPKVALHESAAFAEEAPIDLLMLDEALTVLAELDSRMGRIVELRFFGGLTNKETAEVVSVSEKTVEREWSLARAWLHRKIGEG